MFGCEPSSVVAYFPNTSVTYLEIDQTIAPHELGPDDEQHLEKKEEALKQNSLINYGFASGS